MIIKINAYHLTKGKLNNGKTGIASKTKQLIKTLTSCFSNFISMSTISCDNFKRLCPRCGNKDKNENPTSVTSLQGVLIDFSLFFLLSYSDWIFSLTIKCIEHGKFSVFLYSQTWPRILILFLVSYSVSKCICSLNLSFT